MCRIILWASKLENNQWKCRWWNKIKKRNGQTVKAACDRCEEANESETFINVIKDWIWNDQYEKRLWETKESNEEI